MMGILGIAVVVLVLLIAAGLFLSRGGAAVVHDEDLPEVSPHDDARAVAELVAAGRKIEAVKLVRESTGMGLKEARDHVEAMASGQTPPLPVTPKPDLSAMDEQVRALVDQDRKIEAIKLVRDATGLSLKEAKERVEAIAGR